MSSQTNSLNVSEPLYFHREYINDIGEPSDEHSWIDQCKRIGLVALPFVSLYKPLSLPLSLTMGGLRTVTSLGDLSKIIESGNCFEIGCASLQTVIAVIALAGTIFAHPLGMLITTSQDLIVELSKLVISLNAGEYQKAIESCLNLVNNALYLALFLSGGLEIAIASLSMQILIGLYHSVAEFAKGNCLEGAGHILMALVRADQLNHQMKALQLKGEIDKLFLALAGDAALDKEKINSRPENSTQAVSEKLSKRAFFFKGSPNSLVDETDIRQKTALLHECFDKNDFQGIKRLVSEGVDINSRDFMGKTVLYKCLENSLPSSNIAMVPRNAEMVHKLVALGADVNFCYAGKSITHLLLENVATCDLDVAIPLLKEILKFKPDLNYRFLGKNPVEFCFDQYKNREHDNHRYLKVMDVFFELGHANPQDYLDLALTNTKSTSRNWGSDLLNILMKYELDLQKNHSLIAYLIQKNDTKRVLELARKGAAIDSNHLYLALKNRKMDLFTEFVRMGVSVNGDGYGFPVHSAIIDNDLEGLMILNGLNADLAIDRRSGRSYLVDRDCLRQINDQVLIYLLEHGNSDPNYRAPVHGWTPLSTAYEIGKPSAFKILFDHGANLDALMPRDLHGAWSVRDYILGLDRRSSHFAEKLRRIGLDLERA